MKEAVEISWIQQGIWGSVEAPSGGRSKDMNHWFVLNRFVLRPLWGSLGLYGGLYGCGYGLYDGIYGGLVLLSSLYGINLGVTQTTE